MSTQPISVELQPPEEVENNEPALPEASEAPSKTSRRQLSEEDKRQISIGLHLGKPMAQIAREIGRAQSVVHRFRDREHRPSPKVAAPKKTWSRKALNVSPVEAQRLRQGGLSQVEIARRLGVSAASVGRLLKMGTTPAPRMISAAGLQRISAAQKKRWAQFHSGVKKFRGKYRCPECDRAFTETRHLGRHRSIAHGVASVRSKAASASGKRSATDRPVLYTEADGRFHCPQCAKPYTNGTAIGYHLLHTHGITEKYYFRTKKPNSIGKDQPIHADLSIAQPIPPNSPAGPRGWTDESISGFIFAHVVSVIENACKGREDSQPGVTERVAELLHHEVLRLPQRAGYVRAVRDLS